MQWYLEMSVLEQVYFWIAAVASVFLVVQIVMMLFSFGGGDFDADGDVDGFDGDGDSDGGLSFFSVKGLTAFFALGGWCGFAAATYLDNVWLPILISVFTGTAALLGVGFAMRGLSKLQCEGTLVPEKLVGQSATVYVSVPPARGGRGKITLTAQGKYMELDAMTDSSDRLAVDEQVEISAMEGDCCIVKKKTV